MNCFLELHDKDLMSAYQFKRIGRITSSESLKFSVDIDVSDALGWEKCVYIFMFNGEIMRVGSSKGALGKRMRQWSRDVTHAFHRLNGINAPKSNTPDWEAKGWIELIQSYGGGEVYARRAATVTTPIGTFEAYMDEESILINRHKPPMNRHTNR